MRIFLFILCAISFLSGIMTSLTATTIFQQITAGISFITSAIFLIGAAIVEALNQVRQEVKAKKAIQ